MLVFGVLVVYFVVGLLDYLLLLVIWMSVFVLIALIVTVSIVALVFCVTISWLVFY